MEKRLTSARRIILNTLKQANGHLTAHEIYDQVKPRLPSINPSTVYRSLDFLAGQGWISVSDIGTGMPVYESVGTGIHHHLVCQECGEIFNLNDDLVQDFFSCIEREKQFSITTNHLILFGLCQRCASKKDE